MSNKQKSEIKKCPFCDAHGLTAVQKTKTFGYGVGEMQVAVRAQLPYLRCPNCDAEIETEETGRLAEDAGRRALGMMVGKDLKNFRNDVLGLSIRDMSRITGVGTASLIRWEKGKLRPNRSMDLLMMILRDFPETAAYAKRLAKLDIQTTPTIQNQKIESLNSINNSSSFEFKSSKKSKTALVIYKLEGSNNPTEPMRPIPKSVPRFSETRIESCM